MTSVPPWVHHTFLFFKLNIAWASRNWQEVQSLSLNCPDYAVLGINTSGRQNCRMGPARYGHLGSVTAYGATRPQPGVCPPGPWRRGSLGRQDALTLRVQRSWLAFPCPSVSTRSVPTCPPCIRTTCPPLHCGAVWATSLNRPFASWWVHFGGPWCLALPAGWVQSTAVRLGLVCRLSRYCALELFFL